MNKLKRIAELESKVKWNAEHCVAYIDGEGLTDLRPLLAEAQRMNAVLERELEQERTTIRTTDAQLTRAESQVKTLTTEMAALKKMYDGTDEELTALEGQVKTLESEKAHYVDLAAAMYQAAGAYGMPVRILDALSSAGNNEPFDVEGLLPVDLSESRFQQGGRAAK